MYIPPICIWILMYIRLPKNINTLNVIEQTIASTRSHCTQQWIVWRTHFAVAGSSRRYYGYIDCKANANVLYAGQAVKPSTACVAVVCQTNSNGNKLDDGPFLEHQKRKKKKQTNTNSKSNYDAQWFCVTILRSCIAWYLVLIFKLRCSS